MRNLKRKSLFSLFPIPAILLSACIWQSAPLNNVDLYTTPPRNEPTNTDAAPMVFPSVTSTALQIIPTLAVTHPPPTQSSIHPINFAVIGDYGEGNQAEQDVANLVKSWNPDFIITTGDNNYPNGAAETIDEHIGKYYHEYIHPYVGTYGGGADQNRFFPSLGNHDWTTLNAQPYLDYFSLPGIERYYDFTWEPVHFFVINSDSREPDGVSRISTQAEWLKARLSESHAVWKVVYFHHPPYSSGYHGSIDWMRWPFQEWGASAVLAGHDHIYERLMINGIPYFINGLGGGPIYSIPNPLPESAARYNADYGAILVAADGQQMTFQFINRSGDIIDTHIINR